MTDIRMTYPTAMVLQALAAGHRYGFEIATAVGLRPGAVYQILHRLEEARLVSGAWEDPREARSEGRPSRRYYRLGRAAEPLVTEARRRFPDLTAAPGREAFGAR
ncbi:MAG: PadR family transcriptional regulator [Gemmatimonadales bacterium]